MKKLFAIFLAAILLMGGSAFLVRSQISSLSGLAVAQQVSPVQWNNVRDAIAASTLAGGVLASGVFAFDGSTMSRITGTVANGIDVDVTRIGGGVTLSDAQANPTNALEIGSFLMLFNSATWDRARSQASLVDGSGGAGVMTVANYVFDETAGDSNRWRDDSGLSTLDADGVGIASVALRGVDIANSSNYGAIHSIQNSLFVEGHGQGQGRVGTVTSVTVSAADTAVVQTLAGQAGTMRRLYSIEAFCSAGTSELLVENEGGTDLWTQPAGTVGTTAFFRDFVPVALTNPTIDNDIVVTLATCGGGNTGTLIVRSDQQGQ